MLLTPSDMGVPRLSFPFLSRRSTPVPLAPPE